MNFWKRPSASLLLGAIFFMVNPTHVFAQATPPPAPTYVGLTPEDVGVMNRARPEYDAKGIPIGGFRLFPTLDLTGSYDDNVFRLPTGTSDYYFVEAPTLRLKSDWGRHFLEFYVGANNYNYVSNTQLNLTDWDVGTDGRLDISRAMVVSGGISYAKAHEALQSPNTVGFQRSPNKYDQTEGKADATYQPDRLGFGVGGIFDRYFWLPTPEIGTTNYLFNSDRDEDEYQAYAKTYYDFSPGYDAFVKATYDSRTFDRPFDRTGIHRASTGYRFDGGADFQISHLIKGEVFIGYLEQDFDQHQPQTLKDIDGLDYGANISWYADPKLTVHLNASHTITDAVLGGVSAFNNQNVSLGADYELMYNVILQGYGAYTNTQFTGSTRTDGYPSFGIKARYMVNEYIAPYISYDWSERSSNFPGVNFKDNLITIGISGHI